MGDVNPDVTTPQALPTSPGKELQDEHVKEQSSVLYRQLRQRPLKIVEGRGSYLITDEGMEILDATGGAAVSCIGHSDKRVHQAILEQMQKLSYCYSLYFTHNAAEKLSKWLVDSTGGRMSRAFIVSSGKASPSMIILPSLLPHPDRH